MHRNKHARISEHKITTVLHKI